MLQPIIERERRESFSPQPHAVATDGRHLWISSRTTRNVDVLDLASWKKIDEIVPPGMPWGMAYDNGVVAMTCGESDEDHRRIRRHRAGEGFADGFIGCPDDAGSHLAVLNGHLVLGQWYKQRLLVLASDGSVMHSHSAPHGVAGVAVKDGDLYILGTDEEEHGAYWITRIDRDDPARSEDVALVPFRARSLAYDGTSWWTNHREADRIVSFTLPV